MSERITIFKRELSYISDEGVKKFAKRAIEDCDDYFFTVPASSSGKYHPDFARGNGGLIRHTKAVAYFTEQFCRAEIQSETIDRHQADLLICAAILHDIKKQGDGSTCHTVKEHPQLAADYIEEINDRYALLNDDDVAFMKNIVRRHMGPWDEEKPNDVITRIIFYADYVASRPEIEGLKFISENDNDEVTEPVVENPKMTIDEHVFNFGKIKGMTLNEAYEKNPGYLTWIANKEDFSNVEVKNLIVKFLKTKK